MTQQLLRQAADAYYRLLAQNFYLFLIRAFYEVHPTDDFIPNWSVQALVYELEQVYAGKKKRLIINLPPRELKSFSMVAFCAFLLGNNPALKIVCVSYAQDFADKLSFQFRQIVTTSWYRRAFPKFEIARNTVSELVTTMNGCRFGTSISGVITGLGFDVGLIDEPIGGQAAQTEAGRKAVNDYISSTFATRFNNFRTSRIVVIMQRFHEDDLSGHLLSHGGWDHFKLPAMAKERKHVPLTGGIVHVWEEGELLNPALKDEAVLNQRKAELTAYHYAAQFDQEPVPFGGNLLKIDWLGLSPDRLVPSSKARIVLSWDTAFTTSKGSSYSVCLTLLVQSENEAHLIGVFRERLEFPELSKAFIEIAQRDKPQAILVEKKGSGVSLIQTGTRAGIPHIIGREPEGDKEARMIRETPKLEAKQLFLPRWAPWKEEFLHEYRSFPGGRHNDQVDALSQFLNYWNNSVMFTWDFGTPSPLSGASPQGGEAAPDPETFADLMAILRPPWRG
jgi:predicted phage terminase large subunit-like protein